MKHTIQEIVDNQDKNKEKIIDFLVEEYENARKGLYGIKTKDLFIEKEKEKLIQRFKKTDYRKIIQELFFMSKNRNEKSYAWWDEKNEEVIILEYGRKKIIVPNRHRL